MNYDFSLVHRLCFYVSVSVLYITSILSTTIILSTQPYYLSILSTQLCHSICPLSLNFTAFDKIENAVKSHLNATNPLKPKPSYTPTFQPVTSTRHTQRVIARLFANISINSEKSYFVGFRQFFILSISNLLLGYFQLNSDIMSILRFGVSLSVN